MNPNLSGKKQGSNILKIGAFLKSLKHRQKLVASVSIGLLAIVLFSHVNRFVKNQEPDFLTFNELKKLSQNPHPGWWLEKKLAGFWRTPIISNEAYYRGVKPYHPKDPKLGPYLRLVSWNIEKSYRMADAIKAFSSKDAFEKLIDDLKAPPGSERRETILRQRERLGNADVILLQEMDIGVKRSGYINAAGELAKALQMNYAFAPEQLEIDPVLLGLEKINYENGTVDQAATDHYAVDPQKYKGAFGCAVLSRYPIKKVQAWQLKNQAYDWGASEREKFGFFEEVRRAGAEWVFRNQITREIKAGGRIYFRVDLEVPGIPENTLTIINIHFEIKCLPKARELQMAEVFSYVKSIRHPVIIAGDFNAAPEDLSATSAKRIAIRTAQNPTAWLSVAVSYFLPQALLINTTRFVYNFTKNIQDPLASDIAVIAPNPLHPLFQMIQNYRFNDGGAFDFRGDPERSTNGHKGALANSNERDLKGFKTTFSVKRPLAAIFGKYRLDWIFVKSFLKEPFNKNGPYRFAPHFGETLEEMNTFLTTPISDHHPNVTDIPFQEPKI